MATDPYSTLGVTKSASEAEIKKAYRKLAKELHPDTNKDNPKAAERFARVTQAYDILSDKTKRGQFDRGEIDGDGNPAFAGFGGGGNPFGQGGNPFGQGGYSGEQVDLGSMFEGLFGGGRGGQRGAPGGNPFGSGFGQRQPPPQKGATITYRLAITFEDAATAAAQRLTLQDGKTIDVKLPAPVEDGKQIRLGGKGQAGPGGAGDAIITLSVRAHRFFTRDGDNVRLDLPVTLNEAIEGAKVRVPTVDGAVMLSIPAGANSGQTLRLKGKGFTTASGRGDQLVTLVIDIPKDDPALRSLVESWHDERNVRAGLGV